MRIIRVRLGDPQLRRVVGASDVFQSVMGSFFVRAALGQYDLKEPQDLLKLLAVLARNKVADQARRRPTEARDASQRHLDDVHEGALAAPGPSPSVQVELKQLAREARARLHPSELELLA